MIELCRETYRYRELIWALALKELKIRYKRSVLGFLWALLNPMLFMLVLTVVFTVIMPMLSKPHYAIFVLSALIPWTFFAQSLSYAAESIVGNADLIKKVRVAKLVFPVAALVSNMINLLLSLIPLAVIVLVMRLPFSLDLDFPAGTSTGSDSHYAGDEFFLCDGECLLSRHFPYFADCFAALVLRQPDHLFAGFCSGQISDFLQTESDDLRAERIPLKRL